MQNIALISYGNDFSLIPLGKCAALESAISRYSEFTL